MFSSSLILRRKEFIWGARTYVMGILNVTPDSFSGDGVLARDSGEGETDWVQRAVEQARLFASAGADVIDVGGESTRPDAQAVGTEVELLRVVPVVRALAAVLDLPISVDTYKASVADAALEAGASIVNDVWGFQADPDIAAVAARRQAAVILMHNRSSWAPPEVAARLPHVGQPYQNLLADVQRELMESVSIAHAAGIPDERIILDPGVGFGKTRQQNLELVNRLDEIRALGYPVLLGPSRKSFIGNTLNLPADQRLEGTAAAVAIGIARGADLVRVHDVLPMVRVARMTDAITRRDLRLEKAKNL